MKNAKLHILVNDTGTYPALIHRLAAEGHVVNVTYPQNLPPGEKPGYLPGFGAYLTEDQILSGQYRCDLYIGFELEDRLGRALQMLGIPVFCHSQDVYALETNRALGAAFIRKHTDIKIVGATEFTTRDDALEFLRKRHRKGSKLVLKPSSKSVGHETNDLRCHFSTAPHTHGINVLKTDAGYFDEAGNGGVRFENFINGVETCIGSVFNGREFDGVFYVCHEHKDATNGSRSGVLTGEVGTTMTWHSMGLNPQINAIFEGLAEGLRLSNTRGFIDLNLMLGDDGEVYLIEWTCRFGRPTLEMVLATYKGDFGRWLLRAAYGQKMHDEVKSNFHRAALGVVAFPYGYPIVEREHQFVTYSSLYRDLKHRTVYGTQFMPMISIMLGQQSALCDDRYGIAVAVGEEVSEKTVADMQKITAWLLEQQKLPHITWRDDIGSHWLHDLKRANLCLELGLGGLL